MLPIVELRGAVPVGTALGLDWYINLPISIIGNLLPVPFILLFIPKILDFLEGLKPFRPIVQWVKKKAYKNRTKIIKTPEPDGENAVESKKTFTKNEENTETCEKKQKGIMAGVFSALFLFVFIPLPGTGAWTGSLVASLFNLPKRESFIAIALGVLGCGIIMGLASYGVLGFLEFLI
jgi:uncharacterized membrane protein